MPLISIVISAHDRKKYLKDALQSTLDQSFPRNNYEIIVVKNFIDEEIDKFIQENVILSVFTRDATLGQKMAAGIERSSGSIICFLDDDDKFVRDKLTYVYDAFTKINNLGYFHNASITIDETGRTLTKDFSAYPQKDIFINELSTHEIKKARKYNGDWFMSCISVSRELAQRSIPILKEQKASFDKLLFYNAILTDMKMLVSSKKLTYYRLHPSMTTIVDGKESLITKKKEFFLNTSMSLHSIMPEKNVIKGDIIELAFLHETVNYSILSGKRIKFREFLKFLRLSLIMGTPSDLKWAVLYALNLISNNIAKDFYVHTIVNSYS